MQPNERPKLEPKFSSYTIRRKEKSLARSPGIQKTKSKLTQDCKEEDKAIRYISNKYFDSNESNYKESEPLLKQIYDKFEQNQPERGYHRHIKSNTDKVKSKFYFLTQ